MINSLKDIIEFVLNYDKPFLFHEMVDLLDSDYYNASEISSILENLYENNLLYYDLVLPENSKNNGYAFVTKKYYEHSINNYIYNRLNELNINDKDIQDIVLMLVDEITNNKYIKTKKL